MCFTANVGVSFKNQTMLGAIFVRIFRNFAQIFRHFALIADKPKRLGLRLHHASYIAFKQGCGAEARSLSWAFCLEPELDLNSHLGPETGLWHFQRLLQLRFPS